jgi:hypothetical protein
MCNALVEHRVAPGEIGPHQHNEIGQLEILVAARHGIGAEGPLVGGNGRGHAEARIGIDIGGTDETLHQLVGDVVILGEELARAIEGDGIGAVFGDGAAEGTGDQIEGLVPPGAAAVDLGM